MSVMLKDYAGAFMSAAIAMRGFSSALGQGVTASGFRTEADYRRAKTRRRMARASRRANR